jgi:transposase
VTLLEKLEYRNVELLLKLAASLRERSGRRSERIDPAQLALLLELCEAGGEEEDQTTTEADDVALEEDFAGLPEDALERRCPRRRRPPRTLPREIFSYEMPVEERQCASCGKEMGRIGEDVSETLELIPAHFVIHEHRRAKYACSTCKDAVRTAPGPAKLIEKGLPGPGLLAHVVVSKYEDAIPLNRLGTIYDRGGVEVATSTLCGWVEAVAEEVRPIVERIWEKTLASHALQTDGSGLKVLDRDDPEGVRKGTMWCFVGDERHVVFRYAPTGSGEDGPWKHLAGRSGALQADAASVFDRLYDGRCANATEVGCWAHVRRKFHALQDSDFRVAYPLKLISQLYRVEKLGDRRNLSPDEREHLRRKRSGPILGRIERWLKKTAAHEPPESALHKACAYSLNQWVALTEFLHDPLLALDNTLCERQIRSLAVGRKTYLFAGSDAGAERAAILYSLLRTAALAKIDTYAYLIQVIERLAAGWPQRRIDELLPENYTPTPQPTAFPIAQLAA